MSTPTPYSINSDVKFSPLELIDVNELQKAIKEVCCFLERRVYVVPCGA
jgi:hypothetical protein